VNSSSNAIYLVSVCSGGVGRGSSANWPSRHSKLTTRTNQNLWSWSCANSQTTSSRSSCHALAMKRIRIWAGTQYRVMIRADRTALVRCHGLGREPLHTMSNACVLSCSRSRSCFRSSRARFRSRFRSLARSLALSQQSYPKYRSAQRHTQRKTHTWT
jgi:hypothetical protein